MCNKCWGARRVLTIWHSIVGRGRITVHYNWFYIHDWTVHYNVHRVTGRAIYMTGQFTIMCSVWWRLGLPSWGVLQILRWDTGLPWSTDILSEPRCHGVINEGRSGTKLCSISQVAAFESQLNVVIVVISGPAFHELFRLISFKCFEVLFWTARPVSRLSHFHCVYPYVFVRW